MNPPPPPARRAPSPLYRQMILPFDSVSLPPLSPGERKAVVTRLAELLMEAAGVGAMEAGHEG